MVKVSILVCDNGYGHLKRCLSIAYFLSSKGIKVDVYGIQKDLRLQIVLHMKQTTNQN